MSLVYIVFALSALIALLFGWRIVTFLVEHSIVKKETPLSLVSWTAFLKYFQLKKEQDGKYGLVGVVYLFSLSALFLTGVVILVRELLQPL